MSSVVERSFVYHEVSVPFLYTQWYYHFLFNLFPEKKFVIQILPCLYYFCLRLVVVIVLLVLILFCRCAFGFSQLHKSSLSVFLFSAVSFLSSSYCWFRFCCYHHPGTRWIFSGQKLEYIPKNIRECTDKCTFTPNNTSFLLLLGERERCFA